MDDHRQHLIEQQLTKISQLEAALTEATTRNGTVEDEIASLRDMARRHIDCESIRDEHVHCEQIRDSLRAQLDEADAKIEGLKSDIHRLVTENRYSDEITVLNAMIKELQEENAKLQTNDRLTQDDLAEARQRVEAYKSDAEKLDHVLELLAHNMLNGPESLRQFRVTADTILVCIDEVFGKLRVLNREHVAREQATDLDRAQLQLLCEIVHSAADESADPTTPVNVTSRVFAGIGTISKGLASLVATASKGQSLSRSE